MTDSQSVRRASSPAATAGQPRGGRVAGPRARGDRRRQLLTVARELFLRQGYAATSVAAIVRAAGVAQGTFYLYFQSKEHLLAFLRQEVLSDYLLAFEAGIAGPGPADARLVGGLRRVMAAVRRHRGVVRVLRQAATGEETERVWLEGRETLAAPLQALIAEGQAQGALRGDDARMSAHLTLALLDDLLYEALEYRRPAAAGPTLVAAARYVLRGLGADPARIDHLVPATASR